MQLEPNFQEIADVKLAFCSITHFVSETDNVQKRKLHFAIFYGDNLWLICKILNEMGYYS